MTTTRSRLGLTLLLSSLCIPGCGNRKLESVPKQLAAIDKTYNDSARFLAGIKGRQDGLFRKFEETPSWQRYSSEIADKWGRAQQDQFAPVDVFQKSELDPLHSSSSYVFYPFSGPDVLYVTRFFPKSTIYVLAGLERVGDIRKPEEYSTKNLDKELKGWSQALSSIFNRSFFVTSEMDSQFHGRVANGLLPMILLLLARTGHDVERVQYGHLDQAGKFVPEDAAPGVRHMGVEIGFHRSDEPISRKLYYFSTRLGPEFEQDRSFAKFLTTTGTPDTLVKSASFLLHWEMCSNLRSFILEKSNLILEDDTGVPYHYFQNAAWQVQLFGKYSRPDRPFHREYQRDLAAAFDDPERVKPLGFSLGYGAGRRTSSMILAKRSKKS